MVGLRAISMSKIDTQFKDEMVARVGGRNLAYCLQCGTCNTTCPVRNVDKNFNPSEIVSSVSLGAKDYLRQHPKTLYSCLLCNLCHEVCPLGLKVGAVMLAIREQLVEEGLGPLPQHRGVISEQEWAISDSFSLSLYDPNLGKCKRFFFPGCGLSASSPDLVIKTYAYLESKLPGTGIILGCCGAPSHDIGDQPRFQDMQGKITSEMEKAGASEIIVACPDCYHTFKDNASRIQLRSVYEVMAEHGLPQGVRAQNGKTFAIHDSCKTRYESRIQDSVRTIVEELGCQVDEMVFSRDKTRCCGMGGMASYVDLKLANKVINRRANETSFDMLSYCASCRDAFALVGKPSLHLLDLVFNPEWEEAAKRPPTLGLSRHNNQLQLRERLIEEGNKSQCIARQQGG